MILLSDNRSRLPLWLLTFGLALAPFCVDAQLRNDELYSGIAENRAGELVAALNSGLSPDALLFWPQSDRWISLFELALRSSNDEAAAELLRRGASQDVGDSFLGKSLLAVTAQQGLTRTVGFLIERDSTELIRTGGDAMRLAIGYGHTETSLLLLRELQPLVPEAELQPLLDEALRIAIFRRVDTELVAALVQAGADPKGSAWLPPAVFTAIQSCSTENVALVLREGVDPNPVFEGKHLSISAFECFAHEGEGAEADAREILQLLSEYGTDLCSLTDEAAAQMPRAAAALRDLALCER